MQRMNLLTAFVGGSFLRIVFAARMPYWLHAYDAAAHQQYVRFITERWSVPPLDFGWETFQPPFYYVVAAGWLKAVSIAGWSYGSLQILSVLLSILTLASLLWIGALLWSDEKSPALSVYAALVATCPALIHLSSQISNDVLWTLLSIILIALTLRWRRRKKISDWIMLSGVAAIGLFTKATTVLLLPPVIVSVLLLRDRWSKKMRLLAILGFFVILINGWFAAERWNEGQRSIVGNAASTHHSILVPLRARDFTTFNPVAVIDMPFVDDLTVPRREILFEHLFKSTLFGHHVVSPLWLAQLLTMAGMAGLMIAARGLSSRSMPERYLLGSMAAIFIAGLALHRTLTPSVANEHIRFILPIIVPLSVAAAHGATTGKRKDLLSATAFVLALLSGISVVLISGAPLT